MGYGKTYEAAVRFTMSVLRRASDWQEGQHALADHPVFGPWVIQFAGGDEVRFCDPIIREAEERLGEDLPY